MSEAGRDLSAHQDQAGADVRLEWGPNGLRTLAPVVDTVVIVDVLSFTTSVTVAVAAGADVLPYRWADDGEADFAEANQARVAGRPRRIDVPSLSPSSLTDLDPGSRWVLPSANGSALAFAALEHGAETVIAASLRNATAVADHLARSGGTIGVVPAGERWRGGTGPMRVALEDLLGAGAVIDALPPGWSRSVEARAAAAAFRDARDELAFTLEHCASGRELIAGGFGADVALAADLDATTAVPVLTDGAFTENHIGSRAASARDPG